MRLPRVPAPVLLALLSTVIAAGPAVQAAPQALSAAASPSLRLTDDLLDRMIAVAEETRTLHAQSPDDDSEADDGVPTLETMARRMDTNPALHALLARHGFTGQSYLQAMSTLALAGAQARMAGTAWAAKMPGAASVDPRNVDYYRQHPDKVKALAALTRPDGWSDEDERVAQQLRRIDPQDFDDCVRLVPAVLSLTPHATAGSSEAPPSSRIELARATAEIAGQFHSERLKKDFTTMADEVRRHASAKRLESPTFKAALDDANAWAHQRCQGDRA